MIWHCINPCGNLNYLYMSCSLKAPESREKFFSEGKIPIYTFQRKMVGKIADCKRRGIPNKSRNKDSSFNKCQWPYLSVEERIQVKTIYCPRDRKLSLKANYKLANGKKMWKGNGNTTIIIFLEKTWNFTSRVNRTSKHHSDGTIQQHSLRRVRTY